jgi:hypothetical protein
MKKLAYLASVMLVLGMFGMANADPEDDAMMEVFVQVVPNMTVNPLAAYVDMGDIQVGEVWGWVPFRVDANTQTCKFYGAASKLFKGDDPINPEVPPIDLCIDAGISFMCTDANPTGGQDNNAPYMGAYTVNGYPGMISEQVEFESSQNNRFSQDIIMEVCWLQTNPEKPMGEYSGFVAFFAMVVP